MSIFSRKNSQYNEPEDLDSGYQNPYYSQKDRPERRGYDEDDRMTDRGENNSFYGGRTAERPIRPGYYDEEPRDSRSNVYEEEENARSYRDRGYVEEPVRRKVETAPEKPARPVNKGTLYYTPESYGDVRAEIVGGVADCHVVVVNIRNLMGTSDLVRLLDYIMGAVQVLGATLCRKGGNNLLLVPADVEVDEEELLINDDEDEYADEEAYDEEAYDEDYEDEDEE